MKILTRSHSASRFFVAILFAVLLALSACATGPKQAVHSFSFDGWFDKWATQIDLLEYSYGDQYHMVRRTIEPDENTLGYRNNVNGLMPIGEFLYVKWRIKASGEIVDERVDLRKLLPFNMSENGVTFVIDGKGLYVYLITPKEKSRTDPPLLKTYLSKYNVTYEIYPTNTYKQ